MATASPTVLPEMLRTIARDLLTKTRAGEVIWVRRIPKPAEDVVGKHVGFTASGIPIYAPVRTTYEVVLSQSRIVLARVQPPARSDFISFELQNSDGLVVDSLTVEEPDWGDPDNPNNPEEVDPAGDWRLLKELFSEVHRRVTGSDRVLKEVQQALSAPGPIGTR